MIGGGKHVAKALGGGVVHDHDPGEPVELVGFDAVVADGAEGGVVAGLFDEVSYAGGKVSVRIAEPVGGDSKVVLEYVAGGLEFDEGVFAG